MWSRPFCDTLHTYYHEASSAGNEPAATWCACTRNRDLLIRAVPIPEFALFARAAGETVAANLKGWAMLTTAADCTPAQMKNVDG